MIAGLVLIKTNANEPPKWHWMLSFVGFVIALNWIFLLANEMVGLLQALGAIYDVSEAIMGLTIFALVNLGITCRLYKRKKECFTDPCIQIIG